MASQMYTFLETSDFTMNVEVDEEQGICVLHLPVVHKFNKRVFREILMADVALCECMSVLGYSLMHLAPLEEDYKTRRLGEYAGYQHHSNYKGHALYQKEI